MAGEKKGKAYEAVLMYCLETLVNKGEISGNVFWDQRPPEMSIVPDFSIGASISAPTIMLLVTHSGAAKKSTMKMWRNMGELLEIKTRLKSVPRVYSIIFESVIYEELKAFQAAAFDGQLIAGDQVYGGIIQEWVERHAPTLPTRKEDKIPQVAAAIEQDTEFQSAISQLLNDLQVLLKKKDRSLSGLWTLERNRPKGNKCASRMTSFRRAISKLLIFESFDVARDLFWGKGCTTAETPPYAIPLGLARQKIGNTIGADKDILNCARQLDVNTVERALGFAPIDKMLPWILPLRNIHHWELITCYIADNYNDLCNATKLTKFLFDLHRNPGALVVGYRIPKGWPPRNVWLLDTLVELIKVNTGRASGFGYAQLGKEVVRAGYGNAKDLTSAGQFGGGFGLSAWLVRNPASPFKEELVRGMATVLAKRISEISTSRLNGLLSKLPEYISTRIIEDRLCCYSGFDPLLSLARSAIPRIKSVRIRSCFAEKANLKRAGLMHVAQADSTIINCQSVTAAGRDHKKKELCGRAPALRYHWDGERFTKRPGVEKMILLLDGMWTQEDINALVDAGWDEVFYPDELDLLDEAIV